MDIVDDRDLHGYKKIRSMLNQSIVLVHGSNNCYKSDHDIIIPPPTILSSSSNSDQDSLDYIDRNLIAIFRGKVSRKEHTVI